MQQRHIFPGSEVYHLYAVAQTNPDSVQRAANGSRHRANARFDGPTFWSYTTVVANVVQVKGRPFLLLSSTRYSVTTAGQLSALRSAWHGPMLEVPNVGAYGSVSPRDHAANLAYLRRTLDTLTGAASRSRLYGDGEYRRAARLHTQARDYCAAFKLSPRAFPPREATRLLALSQDCTPLMVQRRAANDARRVEFHRTRAERWAAWLDGSGNDAPRHGPTLLRLCFRDDGLDGETQGVETSHGARVPLEDARKLYQTLKLCAASEKVRLHVEASRYLVGPYAVNAVDLKRAEVRIGCHALTFAEIERFALVAGFATAPELAPPAVYADAATEGSAEA